MLYILKLLDNTFIGTLCAGALLALFGLYLYRIQKRTDLEFENVKNRRALASSLYAKVDLAEKHYGAQIKIYDGTVPTVQKLSEMLNASTQGYFKKEFDKEFEAMTREITKAADDLVADLKISGGYKTQIEVIGEKVPLLNFFLLGVSVMNMSSKEDLEGVRGGFNDAIGPLKASLQNIIDQK